MNYLWTTLYVSDLETSLHFYRDFLGLPIQVRMDGPMNIAFVGEGQTQIELIEGQAMEAKSISLGFEVQDLERLYDSLKHEHMLSEIIRPNEHVRFFFMSDPDGYKIQLVERAE